MKTKDNFTPEQNMLTLEWRRIGGQLRNVLWRHADSIQDALLEPDLQPEAFEAAFQSFIDAAVRDMAARRNALEHGGRAELGWEVCISLMGESAILKRMLWDGRAGLGQGDPRQAFGKLLRRALSVMRWPQLAETPEQLKRWERIDQVSRALVETTGDALRENFSRCTSEHFEALLAHAREHHPHDHRLPKKLSTLESFFYRFCRECISNISTDMDEPESDGDAGEIEAWDIASLPGADLRLERFHDCLAALDGRGRAVLFASVKEPDPEDAAVYLTVEAFCKARNISRRQFFKTKKAAIHALTECMQRKEELTT